MSLRTLGLELSANKPWNKRLNLRVPEDLFATDDQVSQRYREPVRSPAVEKAVAAFLDAWRVGDESGAALAANEVKSNTRAHFAQQGVPVFAHPVLPPQFVLGVGRTLRELSEQERQVELGNVARLFGYDLKSVVARELASTLPLLLDSVHRRSGAAEQTSMNVAPESAMLGEPGLRGDAAYSESLDRHQGGGRDVAADRIFGDGSGAVSTPVRPLKANYAGSEWSTGSIAVDTAPPYQYDEPLAYHQDDLKIVRGYRKQILTAAQTLGVSEQAVAGAIAEELDDARRRARCKRARSGPRREQGSPSSVTMILRKPTTTLRPSVREIRK